MLTNFIKLSFATVLLTSLVVTAAPKNPGKKLVRTPTSESGCVELNVPFKKDDSSDYTLSQLQALRNSIYAQYGYKFKQQDVSQEMAKRGCLKDDVTYSYANLSAVDKKNIQYIKAMESDLKDSEGVDFDKSWGRARSSKDRKELLKYKYCNVYKNDGSYLGLLHFGAKAAKAGSLLLTGLLDFKKTKWTDESGEATEIDGTAVQSLDATSVQSLNLSINGTWSVDASGSVQVDIDRIAKSDKAQLKISGSRYNETSILTCEIAK